MSARAKRIRRKDNIATGSCGEAEDCCCAFWCGGCVNIQIWKHLDMRCETGYRLCSPDGIPSSSMYRFTCTRGGQAVGDRRRARCAMGTRRRSACLSGR